MNQRKLYAKGRLRSGQMNKTEMRYGTQLEMRRRAGEIAWFKFEGVKLRLAENCFLTVDFAVMLADGTFEMHDVKGARAIYAEDAKAKMKVAAETYPFRFAAVFPQQGGGWDVEYV